MNSKNKGKVGERELANLLKDEYGFDCKRSQQYCGGIPDSMDVVGLPNIHVECKRNETLNIYNAIEQAVHDNGEAANLPAVFHRKNRKQWLVTMNLSDWMTIYLEYLKTKTD